MKISLFFGTFEIMKSIISIDLIKNIIKWIYAGGKVNCTKGSIKKEKYIVGNYNTSSAISLHPRITTWTRTA